MTTRQLSLTLPLFCALALCARDATAEAVVGGRPVDPARSFTLQFSVGQVTDIKGGVTETTRRLFELEGRDPSTFEPESYTFEELGLTDSDITYGVSVEKMWRYITLRGAIAYMRAEASSSPPRDFFIGVDDIEFEGRSYEYMKLENDVPYDATLDAALISLRLQYTPVTLAPEHVISFTPWVHAGLFALAGTFEIDQGDPQRIQIYENPPREYVVGGHGEGTLGGGAPEIGIGGDLRIWLGRNEHGDRELSVQGTYAIFEYNGSSDALGVSSRNEKDLDVDYELVELRAMLFWPISAGVDLVLGGEYRVITADAQSKSKAKTLEEAQENREKFDKDVDLELNIVNAFAGFRW